MKSKERDKSILECVLERDTAIWIEIWTETGIEIKKVREREWNCENGTVRMFQF